MTGDEVDRKMLRLQRENTRLAGLYWHLNERCRAHIAELRRRIDEIEARLDADPPVERVRETINMESELT